MTFSTDVFHPLIVPLTTYTFSTNASSEDPVSATDEERLPPGGFSLRHGFPHWFGRAKRSEVNSNTSSRSVSVNGPASGGDETVASAGGNKNSANNDNNNKPDEPSPDAKESESPDAEPQAQPQNETQADQKEPVAEGSTEPRTSVPVALLLNYIKSTFDDDTVLDSLPLEAAGNPSAWHAWKAHQKDRSNNNNGRFFAPNAKRGSPQARLPGDWHWDGIWAKRVGHEVEASHSDATLFGSGGARGGTEELVCISFHEMRYAAMGLSRLLDWRERCSLLNKKANFAMQIRFSRLDDATFASVKDMIVPRVEAGGD